MSWQGTDAFEPILSACERGTFVYSASGLDLVQGRLVVKPAPGVPETEIAGLLKANMAREIRRIAAIDARVLEVPAGYEQALADALSQDARVAFAELAPRHAPTALTPNDTYWNDAWHLPAIGAPSAWEYSLGANVTVAVLDSGVDGAHPDFAGRLVPGWNVVSDNADTGDVYGHGTNVAGVVAAATNNATGVAAVTWDAALMPVRVTNETTGAALAYDVADGIVWAADHGARVINVSYEMTGMQVVTDAAAYARGLGAIVILPSGNTGTVSGLPEIPQILTVAATGTDGTVPSWSTRGNHVDLAAPGQVIPTLVRNGGYATASGTSFAAPVVAGVAALVIAANPDLGADEVEQILEASATDIDVPGWDQASGAGRVNADAAVQMALTWSPAPPDLEAPSVAIASPLGGAVSGVVTVSVDAMDNVGVTQVTLFADGSLVDTAAEAPYSFALDTTAFPNGPLDLTAHAYDAAGNEAMSETVTVSVDNQAADTTPPTADITYPTWDKRVSGTVIVKSVASDDVQLASMTLYVDGVELCTGAGPSLDCPWNAQAASRGYHFITLVAYDAAGNTATDEVRVRR